ncbi:ParB/RepB/Spo0J family partition protein, partial [Lutibacter sp.]|uniref:ParB/RepB/Spo0J family partition protein n=1 Tax=Lutibacter sp. TaxID=1925666 RepID=UPI0034A06E35
MENKKRALGKGLEQLFETNALDFETLEEKIIEDAIEKNSLTEVALDKLTSNPYQPRTNFDEESLQELTDSIKEHGVFQPIIVKKQDGKFVIIAGERRVKASKKAGLEKIPAIISDFTEQQMMEIALLENLQREDLNAIEEAKAYVQIKDTLNITQDELAQRVGKSRSHVTNII